MPRFVPRQRKHKVLAREKTGPSTAVADPANQEQIVPLSKAEKEEKRQKLREELRAQQPKVSAKKQKRLDKYIENKLKKDETIDLLKKLEQEKEKYDAVVAKSKDTSSNLGKRTFGRFKEGKGPQKKVQKVQDEPSDVESEDSFEADHERAFTDTPVEEPAVQALTPVISVGSGLAQPLQLDENGLPIIQMKKSKKRKKLEAEPLVERELSWDGFDSEPEDAVYHSNTDESAEDSGSEEGKLDSDGSNSEDDSQSNEDDESESDEDEDDDDDSDDDTSTSGVSEDGNKLKPRNSAFKAWATSQVNKSIGHTPSYTQGEGVLQPAPQPSQAPTTQSKPKAPSPLPEPGSIRKAYAVHVDRTQDIQQSRSELPIIQKEQEIMEAIHNHPVVLIKGDTGSGKTTQVPQFLFEAGYGSPDGPTPGMIGITQPRRVAAVSMAKRVGVELGNHGKTVGYQIRFDSNVSPNTSVKFMTDGILLRELSQDLLLKKYSVIVIDEAHERSVNTDILIGMLSKIVPARMVKNKWNPDPKPLKLIIMSATLNVGDFLHEKLFSSADKPPIVEAEGRQHRVTTHFALRSRADYVEEVIEKVTRAHRKLPRGGILVFLTGQNEIRQVADRLSTALRPRGDHRSLESTPRVQVAASEIPLEVEDMDVGDYKVQDGDDDFDELEILTHSEDEDEADEFDISDEEEEEDPEDKTSFPTKLNRSSRQLKQPDSKDPYTSVHILPLYSQLPTPEQLKIFEPAPEGSRPIILATNVAETSLTIPGIRFVFDTGRSKERKYNLDTGVQSFEIDYISKASAQQRAGRAGRTGPGHCWRLYTSAVYEQFFPDHAEPEILRAPAESVVLQLKGFAYPNPIAQFPFPSAPSAATLNKAERLLRNLGALTPSGVITDLGKQLSIYPLSPRLGKILAGGINDPNLVAHVLTLVASLAVPEIFIPEAQAQEPMTNNNSSNREPYTLTSQLHDTQNDQLKQAYGRAMSTLSRHDKTSDAMRIMTAVHDYLSLSLSLSLPQSTQFCKTHFLREKALLEILQLRSQLERLILANHHGIITHEILSKSKTQKLSSSATITKLNTLAASGHIDQVAIRYDLLPRPPGLVVAPRRGIDVPYFPLIPIGDVQQSPSLSSSSSSSIFTDPSHANFAVYIHPSSILSKLTVKSLPGYISYTHLQKSQPGVANATAKTRMFPLTPVTTLQLRQLAQDTALIRYGKPVARSQVEEIKAAIPG
ncbi:hypothetical protein B0A52_03415 [Exophiala mesophila]|uniref:RNA helicase n=1 Tax=Exophiala mesophila TaxID=212818 RepID=A0A438N5Q6_EXOME|nr:hypothetical protein B0A52_03415 [Exophiala mesophila]